MIIKTRTKKIIIFFLTLIASLVLTCTSLPKKSKINFFILTKSQDSLVKEWQATNPMVIDTVQNIRFLQFNTCRFVLMNLGGTVVLYLEYSISLFGWIPETGYQNFDVYVYNKQGKILERVTFTIYVSCTQKDVTFDNRTWNLTNIIDINEADKILIIQTPIRWRECSVLYEKN